MKLHMQTNSFAAAANDARGAAQGYQARPQQGAPPPPAPAAAAEHPPVVKVSKPCNYGIKCKKSYCKFQHPEVRDLSHKDFPSKPPVGLAFFSPCARRERILSVCKRVHFLLCTSVRILVYLIPRLCFAPSGMGTRWQEEGEGCGRCGRLWE